MKAPAFWYQEKSTLSLLLLPLSYLYDIASTLRRSYTAPVTMPIPVICIGNATTGGAGKTPVALHIGSMLREKGVKAFYLSRGYGGSARGPVLVNPKKHSAAQVGDEPLLLAEMLPTVVCPNRVEGARLALKKGAEVIIMDDGYQNPSLFKSLSVLVVDGQRAFGNGRLLPAGPLREKPEAAIRRAHMIVLVNRTTRTPPMPKEKALYSAATRLKDATMFKNKKLYLFCGIAYPEKFFEMVSATGAKIVGKKAFP
ncbi:MAG: tetraacyldisaccharide 4'-kinase, partial [Alphaproteobacteria bacterium]|nr:tetraacyldisaccharide 4'-kinase [Alphaproteobacteria bacterium]